MDGDGLPYLSHQGALECSGNLELKGPEVSCSVGMVLMQMFSKCIVQISPFNAFFMLFCSAIGTVSSFPGIDSGEAVAITVLSSSSPSSSSSSSSSAS